MRQQRRWYSPCHANSGTSRRGSTAHRVPSRFVPWGRIDPRLFFFRLFCLPLPRTRTFPFPLLLPYPLLTRGMRVSPSFWNTFSPALTFSRSHVCLSRTIVAVSLSFRDRVAHPIPSPCARRRASLPRRRDWRANIPLAHNPSTKRAICNN